MMETKPSPAMHPGRPAAPPARTRVYASLKQAILSASIPPGQRLTEVHLADALRVSRTPVREALHRLEAEGLIVPHAHRGFMMPLQSEAEMDDLPELTGVLEGHMFRFLGERASQEVLAALAETVRQAEAAMARGSLIGVASWNHRFHASLTAGVAGTPRLAGRMLANSQHLMRHWPGARISRDGCQRAVAAHRDALFALGLKDYEVCERVMREHGRSQDALVCLAALAPARVRAWNG